MYDESLIYIVRETILLTLKIILPILGAGVLVGLVISIVQSVTSIQDQTLTFVPKIVGMAVAAIVLAPWAVQHMVEFSVRVFGGQ